MTSEMDQDNDDYMPRSASPAMSRSPEPDRRDKRESDTPSSPAKRGRSDSASQRKVRSPPRPSHAPDNPDPTTIVGVFGLSVRTTERDLEDEFGRVAPVAKVVIVFDARTQRSRGFGFVTMEDIEGASAAIKALNGIELHGRRIRVDFSVTNKAHDPTPGEYRGEARREDRPGGAGGRYPPPPRGWGPPPPWMDPRGPPPPYAYGPPPGRGGYYPPPPPPSNGGGWGRGPPGGGGWGGRGGDRDRRGDRERGGGHRDDRDRRRGGPDDDNWRRRDRSRSPTRRRDRSYSRSPPPRRSRGGDAEEPSRRRDD